MVDLAATSAALGGCCSLSYHFYLPNDGNGLSGPAFHTNLLLSTDKERKEMKIKKVHVYPNVTWATLKSNKKYDIAILELEDEVKLTAKVRTFSILWLDP